jgi:hypothetical protein
MQAGSSEAKTLSWLLLVVQLFGTSALALIFPHADMLEGGCALLSSSLETISLLCAALLQYEPNSDSIQVWLQATPGLPNAAPTVCLLCIALWPEVVLLVHALMFTVWHSSVAFSYNSCCCVAVEGTPVLCKN